MINFFKYRLNVLILLILMASFTVYIIGHGFYQWYSPNSKTIFYIAQSTGLIFYSFELNRGFRDEYQRSFCIIGMLTIAVNSIIYALSFQGVIINAVYLLLILYISVSVITIGVLRNLKKYEHI